MDSDGHAPRAVQERVEQRARRNFTGKKSNRQKSGGARARRDDGDDGNTAKEADLTTGEANDAHADMTENKMQGQGDGYSQSDIRKVTRDGSRPPADQNCLSRQRT